MDENTSTTATIDAPEIPLLDESTRLSKLTVHLGALVQAGAELEMQHGLRAIIVRTEKSGYLSNVVLAMTGVAGFAFTHEWLFLLGAGVAFAGWHRKLVTGARKVRSIIRIDELGQISEKIIEPA
jgi:hypothetical protein